MPKFAKWLIFGAVVLIVGVCVFFCVAPKEGEKISLTIEESDVAFNSEFPLGDDFHVYYEQGGEWVRDEGNAENSFFTSDSAIFDVVLLNFNDVKAFTPETYEYWLDEFEKVSNYFASESHGGFTLDFNIYVGDITKNYTEFNVEKKANPLAGVSYSLFQMGRNATHTTLKTSGEGIMNIVLVSIPEEEKLDHASIFWPHAVVFNYFQSMSARTILSNSTRGASTLVHEIFHTLGLPDLYKLNSDYVSATDIMASSQLEKSTSAYYKKQLTWYDESHYDDATSSNIENIDSDGRYTLAPTRIDGINAYKFGVSGNQFFLAEPRLCGDLTYLTISRINTDFYGNYHAKDQSEASVFAFYSQVVESDMYVRFFGENMVAGNDRYPFFYADESRAYYLINNIDITESGYISFDFKVTSNEDSDFTPPAGTTTPIIDENTYFLKTMFSDGARLTPSEILAFDSTEKKWNKVGSITQIYVGATQYFKITLDEKYTKVKVKYTEYMLTYEKEVKLIRGVNAYDVQFEKTLITEVGDLVNTVKTAFSDFLTGIINLFG